MTKLKIHALAGIFPLVDELVDEIAAKLAKTKRRPTITLYEGKILDGRHRYLACVKAGLEPITKQYTGKDPRGFVIRSNITRRHLTNAQRAELAAQLSTRPRGQPAKKEMVQNAPLKTREAAKLLNISTDQVKRAKAKKAGKAPKKTAKKPKPAAAPASTSTDYSLESSRRACAI